MVVAGRGLKWSWRKKLKGSFFGKIEKGIGKREKIAYCTASLAKFPNFSGTKEGEYMLKMVDENGMRVLRKITEADPALHTLIQNTVKFVRFFRCKVNTKCERICSPVRSIIFFSVEGRSERGFHTPFHTLSSLQS